MRIENTSLVKPPKIVIEMKCHLDHFFLGILNSNIHSLIIFFSELSRYIICIIQGLTNLRTFANRKKGQFLRKQFFGKSLMVSKNDNMFPIKN